MIRKSELKRVGFKPAPAKEPKPAAGPRKKRCKVCRAAFLPDPPWHAHCSPDCGATLALTLLAKQKAKAQRKERAADKVKLKRRADYAKEAQTAMNAWTRERDRLDGCISCDKPATWQGQWHASHYLSVGASPATRFDPANIHKACSICNNHLSGNIRAYRPRLIAKIGLAEVERLDGPQPAKKYSIDDLRAIKSHYQQKLKEMRK